MSLDNESAAVAENASAVVETQEQGKPEIAPVARDYEAEAKEMGWTTKENYKGDPDKWKDAETFVKKGESFLPIVKSQLEKEKAARIKAEERILRLERVTDKTFKTLKADYDAKIAAYEEQKLAAVEAGDVAAYKAIDKKISGLEAPEKEAPANSPDIVFKEKNPWYQVDSVMTAAAVAISNEIAAANPGISLEDNLSQTEARMREEFPHKFKTETKREAAVDPGSDFPGLKPQAKNNFASIPAQDKNQFFKFVQLGAYKNDAAGQAQYAKDYYND